MTNIKFIKSLTTGVALAMALYPQAFAGVATPCGQQAGDTSSNCWSCGSDCSARYDSSTNVLTFSGAKTEQIYGSYGETSPWLSHINKNLSKLVFAEGMESIGVAFSGYGGLSAQEVSLPSTLKEINGGTFYGFSTNNLIIPENVQKVTGNIFYSSGIGRVVIPENTRIYYPWEQGDVEFDYWPSGQVYCASSKCGSNALLYEKDGDNYVVYNKDGSIKQVFGSWEDFAGNKDVISGSYAKKDENGNILATYSGNGVVLSEYSYAADGSVYIRDANGKLVGAKKTSPFTPAEAAALIKKGNNNIIKMTFK